MLFMFLYFRNRRKKKRISPSIKFSCFIPVLILCGTGCPTFSLCVPSASICGAQTQPLTKSGPHMISWIDLHFLSSRPLCLQIGMSDRICCQNPEASLIFWAYLKIYQLKPKLELMSIDKARLWWIRQLQWHRQLWVDQKYLMPLLPLTYGRFPGTTSSVHYIKATSVSSVLLKMWDSWLACFVTDAPLRCVDSYIEKQMI